MSKHRAVPSAGSAGDDSSTERRADTAPASQSSDSLDAIRADIDSTRAELADTVDRVAKKLDVRSRAGDRAATLKLNAEAKFSAIRQGAPPPVRDGLDKIVLAAGPPARRTATVLAPHRKQLALATIFGLLALVVVRHRQRVTRTGAPTS